MKRLSLYSAIVLLVGVFSSCSDNSFPTAPVAQNQAVITTPLASVHMLALPKHLTENKLAKIVSQEVFVTRVNGGDVPVEYTYTAAGGNKVTISMKLHFDPYTVKQDLNISLSLDTETLMADFSPSGSQFDKPAVLSATATGLDFSGVSGSVNLYYITTAFCEPMNASISVDPATGTLELRGGMIPHFSLYGFGFLK